MNILLLVLAEKKSIEVQVPDYVGAADFELVASHVLASLAHRGGSIDKAVEQARAIGGPDKEGIRPEPVVIQ